MMLDTANNKQQKPVGLPEVKPAPGLMVCLKSLVALLYLISGICEFYLNICDLDIWPNLLFTFQF